MPGVGKITKERLENHDYISITTGEQHFGFFLYKTRPGSSAPRKGRCDEFKTWLTNDYSPGKGYRLFITNVKAKETNRKR